MKKKKRTSFDALFFLLGVTRFELAASTSRISLFIFYLVPNRFKAVHSVISFHAKEKITPEEALEFGKEFVDKWYDGFQTLAAVHQNRRHIHIHMVTYTVRYMDGSKYHMNRGDLAKMKEITNDMCRERGLSVAQKGRHFDGTLIAPRHCYFLE